MVRFILPAVLLIIGQALLAQTVPTTQLLPDTAKMTYNQISQQMKLYVFPAKEQSQQQQKEDEFECYLWAVEQSGIDPLNLPKVEPVPVQSGPTGGAVKGAAEGAVAGQPLALLQAMPARVLPLGLLPAPWPAEERERGSGSAKPAGPGECCRFRPGHERQL